METPLSPTPSATVTVVEAPPSPEFLNGDILPIVKSRKKKKKAFEPSNTASSSSCSSSSAAGVRLSHKRRNSKVLLASAFRRGGGGGRFGDSQLEAVALPLGMSFAAIVAQVMERKDAAGEKMSVDHLTKICASAVRESLANVFGDEFNFFARNFEKSFGSTLSTLRLINEASLNKEVNHFGKLDIEDSASDLSLYNGFGCESSSCVKDCLSETELQSTLSQNQLHLNEDVGENTHSLNRELTLHPCSSGPVFNQLSTIEKSVMEQTRCNDLKKLEIGLTMRKIQLKEAQLALNFDSNHLERSKLAMGISKASFKIEKFKTQLEDTRYAELLKKCIDCLVAGLFIMSASIFYGVYVFSYQRITDATASCYPLIEDSKSWWRPKPFSSFNSGWNTLRCHVQVASRMLFGVLIILAVAYLLLQRSGASRQTMPVTFILLLLGAACGFAGKLCVDTLGGSGWHWLLYWETMCMLHFFSNVFPSALFYLLHGPVSVSKGIRYNKLLPYWFRRILFYAILLLVLPLCCGLLPFAYPGEWKEHFFLLATNLASSQGWSTQPESSQ
ncbi:protein CPR-5 [Mercurialis annua]|uniref:protein CPR-5 n=1 Tax=Mercurialis annua TaxID=3986 RepID=UPI00215E42EE|nr:protein CPR-5 [Mercurialis annua]